VDIGLLDPEVLACTENETARQVADPVLQTRARQVSIRALAKVAGVSKNP